jgi:predicted Mrr-cat superfamily restriction endonuclease
VSIWLFKLELNEAQEKILAERARLPLPLTGVPDLSRVSTLKHCALLAKSMYPNDPPERVYREAEAIWKVYYGVQLDDLLAIYLPISQQVALARVTDKYAYSVGEDGEDMHTIGVKWYAPVELRRFGKHKKMFLEQVKPLTEVTNAEDKKAITEKLPYAYNRFTRIKWVLAVIFTLKIIGFTLHQIHYGN